MTEEQKATLQSVKNSEATSAAFDLSEGQLVVLAELGLMEDRHNIAASAFASALRGKMENAITKAIKAKYEAETRGKKALATELEAEIQRGIKMKREL